MKSRSIITSLTAAALAGAVLSGVNISENVKADVKPEGTTTKANSAKENAQANVDSAQKEVDNAQQNANAAKNDLDSAKKNAEKTNADYIAQKDKTDVAQKNEANKKDALDKATEAQKQAKALVDDSKNPDKVKQANDDVKAKSDALDAANKDQTKADKNVSDQDALVKQDQSQIGNLTKNRDDKQNDKNTADQKVKDAEDALKGTGVKEAKDALDDATQKRSDAERNLNKANTDIDTATKNVNRDQQDLDQAQQKKGKADQSQTSAQNAADAANAQADAANKALKAKQDEIEVLKAKLSSLQDLSKNNIDLVDIDKFKQAYADYLADGKLSDTDIEYVKSAGAQNQYVSSDVDKKDIVDVNNMTSEQLEELALFTSDLLTKVRSQLGLGADNTQVTQGSIDFAEKVAQRYVTDYNNGSWQPGWHDATGINELSKENGLKFNSGSDSNTWQYYEDMSGAYLPNPVSMDLLKKHIYEELRDMIIPSGNGLDHPDATPTYEMGHTRGLLGLPSVNRDELESDIKEATEAINSGNETFTSIINGKKYSNQDLVDYANDAIQKLEKHQYYFSKDDMSPELYEGTSYSITKKLAWSNEMNIHFISVAPDDITDSTKFSTQIIPSYADQINDITSQINALNDDLSSLEAKADTANANKSKKDGDLIAAKQNVGLAEKAVDTANKKLAQDKDQLASNQQTAQEAQTAFNQADDHFNQIKSRYDTLTAAQDQKIKNFNTAVESQKKAEAALTEAQNNLDNATNALNVAKDKLKNLQNIAKTKAEAVKKAQAELDVANKHLADLKNAPQTLAIAQAAQDIAQKDYDVAKKAANDAQTQLKTLENVKSASDAQVSVAQAKYDQALANLKNAQDKLANAKGALERIQQSNNLINQSTTSQTGTDSTGSNISTSFYSTSRNNSNSTSSTNQTTTNTSTNVNEGLVQTKTIRLTHNAYVYTKDLKPVRTKSHRRVLLKKNHYLKALNNGKTVTIKSKKFYQIGKNRFIKVSNTVAKKRHILATVKARKNHKVRVYLSNGKFAKKYVLGQKTYRLAEKKTIKGKTYYRIYGKKLWIRAQDLKLVK